MANVLSNQYHNYTLNVKLFTLVKHVAQKVIIAVTNDAVNITKQMCYDVKRIF